MSTFALKIATSENLTQNDLEPRSFQYFFKMFDATERCTVHPKRREQNGVIISEQSFGTWWNYF